MKIYNQHWKVDILTLHTNKIYVGVTTFGGLT